MLPEQMQWIEKLYRDNFEKLIGYAEFFSGDSSIAQDMVQDTFHEALRHIDKLMIHDNPAGWLMNTLKNKIRENRRKNMRDALRILSLDSDILAVPEYIDALNKELSRLDISELMEQIKCTLKPEEYRLFRRFIFDKASHLEVAKEFGISVYASQKRLERIRKKLRETFPEYGQN